MKMPMERFEDIVAWQKARVLVKNVYQITRQRPFSRDFPLRDQICSAAISVPSNIVEGFERYRLREFHQFLSISKGSCAEVRSDLYLARDLDYIDDMTLGSLLSQAEDVGRTIGKLRASVERQLNQDPAPRTQD